MNNFFRCFFGVLFAGVVFSLINAPGLSAEERLTGLASSVGLVVMFRLGFFSAKKNDK